MCFFTAAADLIANEHLCDGSFATVSDGLPGRQRARAAPEMGSPLPAPISINAPDPLSDNARDSRLSSR